MSEDSYNPTKTPLTVREAEMLVLAIQCLEVGEIKVSSSLSQSPTTSPLPHLPPQIKVDYDAFARMAGYGNKKSASNFLGPLIKHKIASSTIDNFFVAPGTGNAAASPTKKRPTPKSKATAASDSQNDGGNEEVEKKSPKKRAAPKSKATASDGQNEAGDGEVEKKSPKKRAAPKAKTASSDNQDGEDDEEVMKKSPKMRAAPKSKAPVSDSQDGEGDEEVAKPSPKKRAKVGANGAGGSRAKKSSADVEVKAEGHEDVEEGAVDEEETVKQEGGEEFFADAMAARGEGVEV
ncbi:MAG: hypothetical protein Q9169_006943 [Polycauliona sp. 2 TL-2023]